MTASRLSMLAVTRLLGTSIGRLRADPTCPPMRQGTFDEAAVMAWKAARDAKDDHTTNATTTEKGAS